MILFSLMGPGYAWADVREQSGASPVARKGESPVIEASPPLFSRKAPLAGPRRKGDSVGINREYKQMDFIRARILGKKGLIKEALSLYRLLRRYYPEDREIWEAYIEILVDHGAYEGAMGEIRGFLEKDPDNIRIQRMLARVYYELDLFEWTFPLYEKLSRRYPLDGGVWSDYAAVKQDVGEWAEALNYFSRVLELDPDNEMALRGVHGILKEHRPRLETGYQAGFQASGKARIETLSSLYTQHLSAEARLELIYNHYAINRADVDGQEAIDRVADEGAFSLRYRFSRFGVGRVTMGGYQGLGDGLSFLVGLEHKIGENLFLKADYNHNRPWYDPVEAAALDGKFNRSTLSCDWHNKSGWLAHLGLEHREYLIKKGTAYGQRSAFYGRRKSLLASLTKGLWERPALYFGYSFFYSSFQYQNEKVHDVPMIEEEGVHALFLSCEHQPWPCFGYSLAGGIRRDPGRSVTSWYLLPKFNFRMGNRMEFVLSYEYSSEADTIVQGGKTETLRLWTKIIF